MSLTLDSLLTPAELSEILKSIPCGYKAANDPFFEDGNRLLKPFVKQGVISFEDEEELHRKDYVNCAVPGCNKDFDSVYEYESHYNALHRYLCNECKKCLPTPHFLDLHILEQHDSYFSLLSQRKPMYSCFLEECKCVSITPEERKDHCIREHKFPANFRFETGRIKSWKSKVGTESATEEFNSNNSGDESLADASSAKIPETSDQKFPKSFTFGHQKQKTFDTKAYGRVLASKQKSGKRKEKMEVEAVSALEDNKTFDDLMESLPKVLR